MPDNNQSSLNSEILYQLLPPTPRPSWSLAEQPGITGTRNDLLEAAARQRRDDPAYDPSAVVRELLPQAGDDDVLSQGQGLVTEAELTIDYAQQKQKEKEKEEIANREFIAEPVRFSDEAYENIKSRVGKSQLTQERLEYVVAMQGGAQRLETLAWIENDVFKTADMIRNSGLSDPEEAEGLAYALNVPRDVVRSMLPYAKDELEARVMAKNLYEMFGSDDAVRNSFVLFQLQNPEHSYWSFRGTHIKGQIESALMERFGGSIAATTGNGPVGRFADQSLYRALRGVGEIGRGNLTTVTGWTSSLAELIGADDTHHWARQANKRLQGYDPYPQLDTGNPKTDWLLDKALIDAPNLYSQIAPYAILGPVYGGYARTASMMGSSLASMEQDGVPLYARIPLAFVDASLQRTIEQKHLYPRFERLGKAIANMPASGRPFGQFLIEGSKDVLKQAPDEFLQESVGKLTHDIGFLFTDGATPQEFYDRVKSGWSGPAEGAATATVASGMLMALGLPRAIQSHAKYRHKITAVQKTLDAAKADTQRQANPESFKRDLRPIVDNALRYNQDAPAEVYLTAERFDEIIPDTNERQELLKTMGAGEEYRRSRSTGASMAIPIGDYATAIAGHTQEAEFQKFIQVDLDGPTAMDEAKMEEVFANLKAESEALVKQMWDDSGQSELPSELQLLRNDLRAIDNMTAIEADQLAALRYSMVKMAAADLGVTPSEYIRTHNVRAQLDDMVKTRDELDAIIRESDAFFASLDAEASPVTESDGSTLESDSDEPGVASQTIQAEKLNRAADSSVPTEIADSTESPKEYQPTATEKAFAADKATDLEKKRLKLGSILAKGGHLSRGQLKDYGLSAWHPQTVRMRIQDMKREADAWRHFHENPALIAQAQEGTSGELPSTRYAQDETASTNPDGYLESFSNTIGNRILVPGLVAPAADKIDTALKAVYSIAVTKPSNILKGVVSRIVDADESAAYKQALTRDKFRKDQFTEAEVEKLMAEDYSRYIHIVDNFGVIHAFNQHGDADKESQRGQEPITSEAISLATKIAVPENLVSVEKNDSGMPVFVYRVEENGKTQVVEEVRRKRGYLAFHDMYGKWGDLVTHDVSMTGENPDNTPLRATPDHPKTNADSSIPDGDGEVKSLPIMQQSALIEADPDTFVQAAVDEVAGELELTAEQRGTLAEGALEVLRAAEDMPEAKALAESMGLVAPSQESETAGRKTKIIFPAEAGAPPLPARYALVELDSLQPSHTFRNYTPNPAWTAAELAQQRNYDSGSMEATRQGIELDRLNYDTLFNPATDAVNGPPIVTQDGKILGGNNRSHRIYNRYDADNYRNSLLAHLQSEDNLTGLKPEAIESLKKPVLVRIVDDVDSSDIPGLIGALNADFTTRRDPANLAANRGMRVGKKTMLAFAAINDQTVAAYLDSSDRARKVLQAMVEDGALQQTDLPGLYDFANDKWLGDGRANGKAQVEQALFGAILPDSRLLDDMAEGMKKKLVRALPALIRLKKNNSPELNHLVQAMAWHAEYADFRSTAEAKGLKPTAQLELFRRPNQKNLFTGETAPEKSGPAWDMFTELSSMRSQKEVAEYFTRKADELAGYSRGLFGQADMAGKGTRGDVTFYDRVTLIRLFRGKADFSTVLHEMGHVFLQELQDRVADGLASETSTAALETLRKLAGGEFTEKGVEKVIKHWEAYLREGRAPSRELVDAFGTFRSWLTGVYEDIKGYLGGEELSTETRDAFDHLLAADKEIREVRDYYYATRDYLESLDIYSPSERKKIQDARKKAEETEQEFQDRMRISAFLRAYESREPVRERAATDIDSLPVYKAIADAVEAGGINADEAIDLIGREAVETIRDLHGPDLFGGSESTLDAIAGDHGFTDGREMLDALVNARAKEDAIKERIREIIMEREEKARGWLKETESVPGDAAYHASDRLELMALQLEGLRKILNDKTQKRIERLNLKALKDAADSTVRDMLVRDIGQHRRYAMAESRAGRESIRAAQAGDYQAAYDLLQLQMFNHAITTAMYRYRESGEKFRRATTFRKMMRALDAMHEDSREPLRQLLTRYGVVLRSVKSVSPSGQQVRQWVTPKELTPITGMKELALPDSMKKGEFDKGGALDGEADNLSHFRMDLREHIKDWVLRLERPADFQNWRDLTVRQMEELRDAIDLVATHGKGELTALRTDRYRTIEEAIVGIVEEIEKHGPERSAIHDPDSKSGQRKNALENFILKGVNLDSVFAVAEGNRSLADKEALQIYDERMRDNEAKEMNWHTDIMTRLVPEFKVLGNEATRLDAEIQKNGGVVDGLPFHESLKKARGKSRFTGEMLVSAVLNTGNADNLFQLQTAYEWNDEHVAVLRRQLTLEGWQAVESIWKEMDKLYPEMDKIRFWATHKHSPKEKGQPFTTVTADGKIHESDGGYYPLEYDGLISRRHGAFQDLSSAKSMAQANMTYTSSKPPSKFAIARARGANGELVYKGPPKLALSPILKHFHEVLHFVTHAQTLYEIDRITADSRFEKAFIEHNGLAAYKLVRKTINYMADFRQEQSGGAMMNWLHNRYITSVLGINFYSANKQRLGYFTALSPMSEAVITGENGTVVALRYLCNAIWDFGVKGNIGLMTERFEAIKNESRIMKARDEGGATQELRNAIEAISPTGGDMRIAGMTIPVKAFRDNLFKLIQLFDRATAGPIHTACYRMYMDGKVKDVSKMTETEKKKGALAFADSVAMTQTSPFRVDHSAIQRGENIIDKFSAVCISGVMQPGNMLYQKIAGARRGQVTPGQVASYIAKTYIAMSYTQMLFSTLHGLATGEEDPWPAWYDFILAPLDNMVSWIPYVRNIMSVSKYGSRGKGVPQLEAGYNALIAQPINAVKKAEKGDVAAGGWLAVKSFCFAAGIPVNMGAKIFQDLGKVMGGQPTKKRRGRK